MKNSKILLVVLAFIIIFLLIYIIHILENKNYEDYWYENSKIQNEHIAK